jgi:hypothetical protein
MKGMILSKLFDYIGRRARKEKSDWKAGVHTPRLASVKGATPEKVEKQFSDRGLTLAGTINFLSSEDIEALRFSQKIVIFSTLSVVY